MSEVCLRALLFWEHVVARAVVRFSVSLRRSEKSYWSLHSGFFTFLNFVVSSSLTTILSLVTIISRLGSFLIESTSVASILITCFCSYGDGTFSSWNFLNVAPRSWYVPIFIRVWEELGAGLLLALELFIRSFSVDLWIIFVLMALIDALCDEKAALDFSWLVSSISCDSNSVIVSIFPTPFLDYTAQTLPDSCKLSDFSSAELTFSIVVFWDTKGFFTSFLSKNVIALPGLSNVTPHPSSSLAGAAFSSAVLLELLVSTRRSLFFFTEV